LVRHVRRTRDISGGEDDTSFLSGFSPARSSGGSSSGGSSKSGSSGGISKSSGGGGCSSSSARSHNSYGSGSGSNHHAGNSSSNRDGRARGTLLKCAAKGAGEPAATVRIKNPGDTRTVDVTVDFLDANGGFVDTGSTRATVRRDGTKKVRVVMDRPERIDDVEECRVLSVR
jgi:hypothetical protein